MSVKPYIFLGLVYFFVNTVGLAFGLTWMTLFTPVFYFWILLKRRREVLLPFFAMLLPFVVVHLVSSHLETDAYLVSLVNLTLVYVFCQAFYTFLRDEGKLEIVLKRILSINFFLCLLAIPIYFTSASDLMWMEQSITAGIGNFRRLKMFTYEPSYYALLFMPVFFYFFIGYFSGRERTPGWILVPMLALPLILSFSLGVLAAAFFAIVMTALFRFSRNIKRRRVFNAIVYSSVGLVTIAFILIFFFRDNPLFVRIGNIVAGEDTSGKGRTMDAFILADRIIAGGYETWGIGLGQIKTMGYDVIRSYYLYYTDHPVAIPNAVAETLTIFGWVGVAMRFMIQLLFFFLTRPWRNDYRLVLFLFIFVYQFTGSYLTNVAEYVIWILAFTGRKR